MACSKMPRLFVCIFFLWIEGLNACTIANLESGLAMLVPMAFERAASQGSENPVVSIQQNQTVCLTTGTTRGTYSSASVIVSFTCTGLACPSPNLQQFEFVCDASVSTNMWGLPSDPPPNFVAPIGNLTTSRRTDCGLCVQDASGLGSRFDTVTHCVACDPSCNTGLMECTDINNDDCCIGVVNNTCVGSCTAPERPLDSAGYECTVFCDPLSDPDNGNIIFSSELLVGSVATYTCGANFEVQGGVNRTCEVVGNMTAWSGAAPSCIRVATEEPTVPDETDGTRVTATPSDTSDGGLSTGAIIGIVIGVLVAVAAIVALVLVSLGVYYKLKSKNKVQRI